MVKLLHLRSESRYAKTLMSCILKKAYADVQGAYTMINQQFVEHECMNYKYVNREDDTGAEGLRKAKLSYRPAFMVEKGDVTEKAQG